MSTSQRCPHCGAAMPGTARFCQGCGKDVTKGRGLSAKQIALAVTALVVLAAIGLGAMQLSKLKPQAPAATTKQERPTRIEGAGQMPQWLLSADAAVVEDYLWASSHLAELQYIPCYCGCYMEAGHTDNYACYFKRDKDGAITGYDNHATG